MRRYDPNDPEVKARLENRVRVISEGRTLGHLYALRLQATRIMEEAADILDQLDDTHPGHRATAKMRKAASFAADMAIDLDAAYEALEE